MTETFRTEGLDWEDLRYFLVLARHGSLSAAARAAGVNHATVSRRIAGLEAALGCSLFERRSHGYVLTAEGRAVLAESQPMEEAALAVLRRQDRSTMPGGLVRLTTTRVLADAFLVQRLGDLARRHPTIELELVTESRLLSLARREADLALRSGVPKDSDLVTRRVATVAHGFFADAGWRDRLAAGEIPPLIAFDRDSAAIPEAVWLERALPDHRRSFRSNSWVAQAAACRAGLGIALLPRYLAAAQAGLVPVDLGVEPPARDLWLLVRRDLATVPRVRAVADTLVALFRECRRDLA